MSIGVFDHPWLGGLFADPEMADLWSADAALAHMIAFEAAWSRALGDEDTARAIEGAKIDVADLRAGSAIDGLPVPRLVKQLRAVAGEAAHRGSTSQDVMDTALALTIKATRMLIERRLVNLEAALGKLDVQFGANPLMGRTRMQAATQITVHDRLLSWRLPITNHQSRLSLGAMKIECVQIGGASGDRAAFAENADQITASVAAELGLHRVDKAWHAMRDGLAEFAGTLSLISGHMGKIGQDIALMAQQGIDEVKLDGGGSSSAMPHKQNPILAELLVTLARFNATQVSAMHQAVIHEQERSGAAWALEWMILPQMAQATGRALVAATKLVGQIRYLGTPNT